MGAGPIGEGTGATIHSQLHPPASQQEAWPLYPPLPTRSRACPPGLVTLLAARAFGADAVAITDLKQRNLDLAWQVGAGPAAPGVHAGCAERPLAWTLAR